MLRIRRGDAPEILAVPRILIAQAQAETLMSQCRRDRVLEVIGVCVALPAKIHPGVSRLVNEEWCIVADVFQSFVFKNWTLPRLPRRCRLLLYPQFPIW